MKNTEQASSKSSGYALLAGLFAWLLLDSVVWGFFAAVVVWYFAEQQDDKHSDGDE